MELQSEEIKTRDKISGIFRAVRKLRGLKQGEVSKYINVTQGTISKFEKGILIPDCQKWYQFCERLKIVPDLTYRSGYIFTSIGRDSYKKSTFIIDGSHQAPYIQAKECIPLINVINEMKLTLPFEKLIKKNKIDLDVFRVLDLKIPVSIFLIVFNFFDSKIQQSEKLASQAYIKNLEYFLPSLNLKQSKFNLFLPKLLHLLEFSSEIVVFSKKKSQITIKINKNFPYSDAERPLIENYLKYKSVLTRDILKLSKHIDNASASKISSSEYTVNFTTFE
jgi:transcriptional regulator with XRE-family HTH domain